MARVHTFYHSDLCGSRAQSQTCLSYAEMKQSVRSKHLGSASWKKERFGKPFASERADEARSGILHITTTYVQHLQYLPYGEPYINQHPFGYSERFTLTGNDLQLTFISFLTNNSKKLYLLIQKKLYLCT